MFLCYDELLFSFDPILSLAFKSEWNLSDENAQSSAFEILSDRLLNCSYPEVEIWTIESLANIKRTLLQSLLDIFSYTYYVDFWHKRTACQRSAFWRSSAGNDVVATIIISLFSFFSPVFFSPLRPFLIEGVLGSKTYLAKVA